MKRLISLVVVLSLVATSGCVWQRKVTLTNDGMEATNQSQKETEELLEQRKVETAAVQGIIAYNPDANVEGGGIRYQGTPPQALAVQHGVVPNKSTFQVNVKIRGISAVQPTTGKSEKIFRELDLSPGGVGEVDLLPGDYQVTLTVGNQSATYPFSVDSMPGHVKFGGRVYDFSYPIQ